MFRTGACSNAICGQSNLMFKNVAPIIRQMNVRTISMLIASAMLILALSAAAPLSDADDAHTYRDQLDGNAKGLYDELGELFGSAEPSEVLEVKYVFKDPVLFDDVERAEAYRLSEVRNALTAYYLSDPSPIWLWDLPVSSVDDTDGAIIPVTVTYEGEARTYQTPYSVTFKLTVPEEFRDDPAKAVSDVDAKIKAFDGTVRDKVTAINDVLRGLKVVDDGEGEVSNIHDALVSGSSSSAGIAAAFAVLAKASGLDAATVIGQVMTGTGDETSEGYWNIVEDEGGWYAVDSTMNGTSWRNCLLAGITTTIDISGHQERFGATHAACGSILGTPLNAPQIGSSGYDWPDDRSFFDKYGTYVFGAVIAVVIVLTLLHAVRAGDL